VVWAVTAWSPRERWLGEMKMSLRYIILHDHHFW
jgi:hypothetical protein